MNLLFEALTYFPKSKKRDDVDDDDDDQVPLRPKPQLYTTTRETAAAARGHLFQQLARRSGLEARQSADLRRGMAARLLPSEGPLTPGDNVFYWKSD